MLATRLCPTVNFPECPRVSIKKGHRDSFRLIKSPQARVPAGQPGPPARPAERGQAVPSVGSTTEHLPRCPALAGTPATHSLAQTTSQCRGADRSLPDFAQAERKVRLGSLKRCFSTVEAHGEAHVAESRVEGTEAESLSPGTVLSLGELSVHSAPAFSSEEEMPLKREKIAGTRVTFCACGHGLVCQTEHSKSHLNPLPLCVPSPQEILLTPC